MKKLLLLPIILFGLSHAQFVTKQGGVIHHTRVYLNGTGDTIFTDLDTVSGLRWNHSYASGKDTAATGFSMGSSGDFEVNSTGLNIGDGAALIKINGSGFFDSLTASARLIGLTGATLSHTSNINTVVIGDTLKLPFTGEFQTPIGVDPNGVAIIYPSLGAAGDPVAKAAAIADPGSTDTLAATSFVYAYVASQSVSHWAPPYVSGTTYGVNAIVSYCTHGCDSVYVSNVASNTGNIPSVSPTQWHGYSHPAAIDSLILTNAVYSKSP